MEVKPNFLTTLRIILTPFIIVFLILGWKIPAFIIFAFIIFTCAVITDFLDGWFAKHFNRKTYLGVLLDPIADKILTLGLLFTVFFLNFYSAALNLAGSLFFGLLVILTLRESIITVYRIFDYCNYCDINKKLKFSLEPNWQGKVKTVFLILTVACFILKINSAGFFFFITATIMAYFSLVKHFLKDSFGLDK